MDKEKDIVEFEDYNIKIDLKEIENMDEKELEKCKNKIQEIKKMMKEN